MVTTEALGLPSAPGRANFDEGAGTMGPAYVVIIRNERLAEAVAAGLQTGLRAAGVSASVLVPSARGADFLATEGRHGDLSWATLIAQDDEELDGLDHRAFVAVRPDSVGGRAGKYGRDVVEVPAGTVNDLVRAVIAHVSAAAAVESEPTVVDAVDVEDVARDEVPAPCRRRSRRIREPVGAMASGVLTPLLDAVRDRRSTRRAATVLMAGALGVGGWMLSAFLQPGEAQAAPSSIQHERGDPPSSAWQDGKLPRKRMGIPDLPKPGKRVGPAEVERIRKQLGLPDPPRAGDRPPVRASKAKPRERVRPPRKAAEHKARNGTQKRSVRDANRPNRPHRTRVHAKKRHAAPPARPKIRLGVPGERPSSKVRGGNHPPVRIGIPGSSLPGISIGRGNQPRIDGVPGTIGGGGLPGATGGKHGGPRVTAPDLPSAVSEPTGGQATAGVPHRSTGVPASVGKRARGGLGGLPNMFGSAAGNRPVLPMHPEQRGGALSPSYPGGPRLLPILPDGADVTGDPAQPATVAQQGLTPYQAGQQVPVQEAASPGSEPMRFRPLCVNEPAAYPDCFGYLPQPKPEEPLTPNRPSQGAPADPVEKTEADILAYFNRMAFTYSELTLDVLDGAVQGAIPLGSLGGLVDGLRDTVSPRSDTPFKAPPRRAFRGGGLITGAIIGGYLRLYEDTDGFTRPFDPNRSTYRSRANAPWGQPFSRKTLEEGYTGPGREQVERWLEDLENRLERNPYEGPDGYRSCGGPGPGDDDTCDRPSGDQGSTPNPPGPGSSAPTGTVPATVAPAPAVQPAPAPVEPAYVPPAPAPTPPPEPEPAPAPVQPAPAYQPPTYPTSGATPYTPPPGGYQPPDYSQPSTGGGGGGGWGASGVPPDAPGETHDVQPYGPGNPAPAAPPNPAAPPAPGGEGGVSPDVLA